MYKVLCLLILFLIILILIKQSTIREEFICVGGIGDCRRRRSGGGDDEDEDEEEVVDPCAQCGGCDGYPDCDTKNRENACKSSRVGPYTPSSCSDKGRLEGLFQSELNAANSAGNNMNSKKSRLESEIRYAQNWENNLINQDILKVNNKEILPNISTYNISGITNAINELSNAIDTVNRKNPNHGFGKWPSSNSAQSVKNSGNNIKNNINNKNSKINTMNSRVNDLNNKLQFSSYNKNNPNKQKDIQNIINDIEGNGGLIKQISQSGISTRIPSKICTTKNGKLNDCIPTIDKDDDLYSERSAARINYCNAMNQYNMKGKNDPDDNKSWPGDSNEYNHFRPDTYKKCIRELSLNHRHQGWQEAKDYSYTGKIDPPLESEGIKCIGKSKRSPNIEYKIGPKEIGNRFYDSVTDTLGGFISSKDNSSSDQRTRFFNEVQDYWSKESYGLSRDEKGGLNEQQNICFDMIKPWYKNKSNICHNNKVLSWHNKDVTGSRLQGSDNLKKPAQFNLVNEYNPNCMWTQWDYNSWNSDSIIAPGSDKEKGCGGNNCVPKIPVMLYNDHIKRNNRQAHQNYINNKYYLYKKKIGKLIKLSNFYSNAAYDLKSNYNNTTKANINRFINYYKKLIDDIEILFGRDVEIPINESPIGNTVTDKLAERVALTKIQDIYNRNKFKNILGGKNGDQFTNYMNQCEEEYEIFYQKILKHVNIVTSQDSGLDTKFNNINTLLSQISDIEIEIGYNFPTLNLVKEYQQFLVNADENYRKCFNTYLDLKERCKRIEELSMDLLLVKNALTSLPSLVKKALFQLRLTGKMAYNSEYVMDSERWPSLSKTAAGGGPLSSGPNGTEAKALDSMNEIIKYNDDFGTLAAEILKKIDENTEFINSLVDKTQSIIIDKDSFIHYGSRISISILESEDMPNDDIITGYLSVARFGDRSDSNNSLTEKNGLAFVRGKDKNHQGLSEFILLDPSNPLNTGPIRYYDPVMIATSNFINDNLVAYVRNGRNINYSNNHSTNKSDELSIEFKKFNLKESSENNYDEFTNIFTLHPEICADVDCVKLPNNKLFPGGNGPPPLYTGTSGIIRGNYGNNTYIRNEHLVSITPRVKDQYEKKNGVFVAKGEYSLSAFKTNDDITWEKASSTGQEGYSSPKYGWYGKHVLTLVKSSEPDPGLISKYTDSSEKDDIIDTKIPTFEETLALVNTRCYTVPTITGQICKTDPRIPLLDHYNGKISINGPSVEQSTYHVAYKSYDVLFKPGNDSDIGGILSNVLIGNSESNNSPTNINYIPARFKLQIKDVPNLVFRNSQKKWLGNKDQSGWLYNNKQLFEIFDRLDKMVDQLSDCVSKDTVGNCVKYSVRANAKWLNENTTGIFNIKYLDGFSNESIYNNIQILSNNKSLDLKDKVSKLQNSLFGREITRLFLNYSILTKKNGYEKASSDPIFSGFNEREKSIFIDGISNFSSKTHNLSNIMLELQNEVKNGNDTAVDVTLRKNDWMTKIYPILYLKKFRDIQQKIIKNIGDKAGGIYYIKKNEKIIDIAFNGEKKNQLFVNKNYDDINKDLIKLWSYLPDDDDLKTEIGFSLKNILKNNISKADIKEKFTSKISDIYDTYDSSIENFTIKIAPDVMDSSKFPTLQLSKNNDIDNKLLKFWRWLTSWGQNISAEKSEFDNEIEEKILEQSKNNNVRKMKKIYINNKSFIPTVKTVSSSYYSLPPDKGGPGQNLQCAGCYDTLPIQNLESFVGYSNSQYYNINNSKEFPLFNS